MVTPSGLAVVKQLIEDTIAEEEDERKDGNQFALERQSAYENVLEWIEQEMAKE